MDILLVDDEAPARRRLRRLLDQRSDVTIAGEAGDGLAAVKAIREHHPDLVLLDIEMPGLDGFGVIAEVGLDAMPEVVFITAYDAHALKAFEVHALDYLLKPVDPARLDAALDRAQKRVAAGRGASGLEERLAALAEALAPHEPWLTRILVHRDERAYLLPMDRVDLLRADRNHAVLGTANGEYRVRTTFSDLLARLDPGKFLQINRSEAVRLDAVKELQPWFHGDYRVILHSGTALSWSRRYRARDAGRFGLKEPESR
ncbi:MAG: LytR/AlgR family response regulator transcription factor [Gemmatimonadales bacterium]